MYQQLYYFNEILFENKTPLSIFHHMGAGDFSHFHANNKEKYIPLTKSYMLNIINKNVCIIISENYVGKNPILAEDMKKYSEIVKVVLGIY